MVKLGEQIFNETDTQPLTKKFVGNSLTCNSCHLEGGRSKKIGTIIGTAAAFPAYSSREKTILKLYIAQNTFRVGYR